jgi:hypothetical protein
MQLDFAEGDAGFFEARALAMIARTARAAVVDDDARQVIDFLREAASAHVARPEYAQLRAQHGDGGEPWPTFSAFKQFWRRTVGPSQHETELSAQRSAALERAERAEGSAFEALAETARVGRERDEARAEIARLRKELAALESEVTGVGYRQPGD